MFITSDNFNVARYSDVTIKSGEKSWHCHKVILASSSEYFSTMLKRDSQFQLQLDGNITVVELGKNDPDDLDDPEALEVMLEGMYGIEKRMGQSQDWRFHLELAIVADKYLVETIARPAFDRFIRGLKQVFRDALKQDAGDIVDLVVAVKEYPDISKKDDYRSPGGIADALVRLHNFELREKDAFITRLAAYPELLLWFVRMFKVVKVQSCAAADGICRGVQKLPKFARAVGGRPQKARCATCGDYTLEDVEMLVQEERVYDWIQEKPTVVNDGDVVVLD